MSFTITQAKNGYIVRDGDEKIGILYVHPTLDAAFSQIRKAFGDPETITLVPMPEADERKKRTLRIGEPNGLGSNNSDGAGNGRDSR